MRHNYATLSNKLIGVPQMIWRAPNNSNGTHQLLI